MDPVVDGEHVAGPLAVDQGESSWLCAELVASRGARRRIAVLAWLHRTGPRLRRLESGPGIVDRNHLPAVLRDVLPSWLPLVAPVRISSDDRPLLMVVLYDLDRPGDAPLHIEREIEHADFDARTFSGVTRDVALRVHADSCTVEARTSRFSLRLRAIPVKRAVSFGDASPLLRHGEIEVGYYQRPRVSVTAELVLDGERIEGLAGGGAHDRHWRSATVANLAWLWLHLRLVNDREACCYVIRDSRDLRERARAGWWIADDGTVYPLGDFDLAAHRSGYSFTSTALGLRLSFAHAVDHPYLPMGAFGHAIDGGIAEAPIRILDGSPEIEGWLEVFDASTCRVR